MKRRNIFLVLILSLFSIVSSCGNSDDPIYEMIVGNWMEKRIVKEGVITAASGRQHLFRSNMVYHLYCAIDEYDPDCQGPDGEWALLTDTTLQTIFKSVITVYTIKKIDAFNLHLEYREQGKPVVIEMEPY